MQAPELFLEIEQRISPLAGVAWMREPVDGRRGASGRRALPDLADGVHIVDEYVGGEVLVAVMVLLPEMALHANTVARHRKERHCSKSFFAVCDALRARSSL